MRPVLSWLALGCAGLLVLPWYADGGLLQGAALNGPAWLWPLALPMVLGAWGRARATT